MKFYKFILFAPLLLISSISFATGWSHNWAEVKEVWVVRDGSILVSTTNMANPENCSDQSWFEIPADHPEADRLHSTLLMALSTEGDVLFFFSGGCYNNRPRIQGLKLRN